MVRIPFLYGRGSCIFCQQQPPTVKISKEHIFGDWLREMFPRDAGTTHTHGIIKWPFPGSQLAKPSIQTRIRPGHSGSKKVRAVCETCNSGWMSTSIEDLERDDFRLGSLSF
jgi:hypothetical protein